MTVDLASVEARLGIEESILTWRAGCRKRRQEGMSEKGSLKGWPSGQLGCDWEALASRLRDAHCPQENWDYSLPKVSKIFQYACPVRHSGPIPNRWWS